MIVLLLSVATSLAASPVLPTLAVCEGSRASDWEAQGRRAGITFVDPGAPATITCKLAPDGWELRAVGADGATRGVKVAEPLSQADRDGLVRGAWALLGASGYGGTATVPALPTATAATTPPAAASAPPPVPAATSSEPTAVAAPPPLTTSAEPAPPSATEPAPASPEAVSTTPPPPPPVTTSTVAAPPPPPPSTAPPVEEEPAPAPAVVGWISVAPRLAFRPELAFTSGIAMAGGALVKQQLWIGAELSVLPAREILADGADAEALKDFDGELRVVWSPALRKGVPARFAPSVGLGFGLASHGWVSAGAVNESTLAPVASVEGGLAIQLFRDEARVSLVPSARLGLDLGTTETVGDGSVPIVLSPIQGELNVVLRTQIPSGR